MITIEGLKKIHDDIEEELNEIEVVMSEEVINYPNFIHVFKKIDKLWDGHEKEEEELFAKLEKAGYGVPYEKILFAHGNLNKYKSELMRALNSGSEFKMKEALENWGKKLIEDLREHVHLENEIIYRLPEDCIEKIRAL